MANSEASIRLYLDADVNAKLAVFLRSAGYDCVSAREIGHDTLDDESLLTYVANDQRTLLTHNTQDFIPIFERWWHADLHHCGIISFATDLFGGFAKADSAPAGNALSRGHARQHPQPG